MYSLACAVLGLLAVSAQVPALGPPMIGSGAVVQPAPVALPPGVSPAPVPVSPDGISPVSPPVNAPGVPSPLFPANTQPVPGIALPGAVPGMVPPPLFPAPGGPDPTVPPWVRPKVEPAWQTLGPDGRMWFGVDVGIVKPAVGQHLQSTVIYPNQQTVNVIVPQAPLDWTAMPVLQLGYHSPDKRGDYSILWRMVASSGEAPFVVDGVSTNTQSILNMNVIDLDYTTANLSTMPRWYIGYTIGARYGGVFIESISQGSSIYRKASSNFPGGGPHLRMDASRQVAAIPGLHFVGALDVAALVGNVSQSFAASDLENGTWQAGGYDVTLTATVPTFRADLGITYHPPGMENLSINVGYVFEQWWNVGTINSSTADLYYQGILLRFGLDF